MSYVLMQLTQETQALEFVFDSRGFISMEGGWETSVLFSLGTNRRSVQSRPEDPQGWWGDAYPDDRHPNDEWGSIIWVYFGLGILTQSVGRKVQNASKAALKHFIDDGAMSKIDITFEIVASELLDMRVRMYRPDTKAFDRVWRVHINAV